MTLRDAVIRNSLSLLAADQHDALLKKVPQSVGIENKGNKVEKSSCTYSADRRKLLDVKKNLTTEDVLRLMRQRQGDRTQTELANELGVSCQFITDLFKGRREPGEKLLKALGLSVKKVYEPVA